MAEAKKILIVDDERDYADILRQRLIFEGYDARVAYDGFSGLQSAREFAPDIILLDIMMPEMDGFETARQFRTDPSLGATTIIFLTAYGREPTETQKAIVGDSPIIRKPFEMADLLKALRAKLG